MKESKQLQKEQREQPHGFKFKVQPAGGAPELGGVMCRRTEEVTAQVNNTQTTTQTQSLYTKSCLKRIC